MGAVASPDRLLARLAKIRLMLPEAAPGYRTPRRLPGPEENLRVFSERSSRRRHYFGRVPAYIGPRGWIALRLDRGKVDWDEVTEMVTGSYRQIAPARLVKLIKRS